MTQADEIKIAELNGRVTAIETRLNGHVPEKCIREDEAISNIKEEIGGIKQTLDRIWKRIDAPGVFLQQAIISAFTGGVIALVFILLQKAIH
ncbi:MAG: hypothetical protein ABFD83_13910 [Armatimonadota bacterium]